MKFIKLIALQALVACLFSLEAHSGQPFSQFLSSATCQPESGRSEPGTKRIEGTSVNNQQMSMPYNVSCSVSNGIVSCEGDLANYSCIKAASFTYDFPSKKSQLTETYAGCINPPYLNGSYKYSCEVKELTIAKRSSAELNRAACSGNESDVDFYLLFRDVEIDFLNEEGKSTLGCAFSSGNQKILRSILDNPYVKFNPYLLDRNGALPIELAKTEDMLTELKTLLPAYDINRTNGTGSSVLGSEKLDASFRDKILELWPEAKSVYAEPSEDCFAMNGSELTKFVCQHQHVDIPAVVRGTPLVSIGDEAFRNIGIKEVSMPDSVTRIGKRAFSGNKIEKISFSQNIESIGDFAFENNKGYIQNFQLPKKLKKIGSHAFVGIGLESRLVLPEGVEFIDESAFQYCRVYGLSLPASLKTLEKAAFSSCTLKGALLIPGSVIEIADWAFQNTKVTNVSIGEGVEKIGNMAFGDNRLTTVELPASVTYVHPKAFDEGVRIIRKK